MSLDHPWTSLHEQTDTLLSPARLGPSGPSCAADTGAPLIKSPSSLKQWHPTPVLLPGKSYGRRSLVGCSPWGCTDSDTTERLHFPFSLSCIGEGNGNPLQCSRLENPRDGGAWWAAAYGVAQSRTRLTRLSSSSSSSLKRRVILGDKTTYIHYDSMSYRLPAVRSTDSVDTENRLVG